MESPKISLFLMAIVLCIALLFDQCSKHNGSNDQIPYNPDSAKVHVITFKKAAELASNFGRGKIELGRALKDTSYLNKSFSLPLAEKFNRDAIIQLLNEKDAKGLRIYMGKDSAGLVRMVLVAVDSNNNDITGDYGKLMKFSGNPNNEPVAMEAGQRCPTLCSGTPPPPSPSQSSN